MSTTRLPGSRPPHFSRTPTYTAEPRAYEQRLALNRLRQRPSGNFVKQSRSGGVSLRLIEQEDHATLPVYGCGDSVEGAVNITKLETVVSVEVKVEGNLRLKEVAEGGTTTSSLCSLALTLWNRDLNEDICPSTLQFSLTLPTSFSDGRDVYPLPPTHEASLSGVPGFRASIEYTVSAVVCRSRLSTLLRSGNSTVSTPFLYYPRSRPAVPLPTLVQQVRGFSSLSETPDWRCYTSIIPAKSSGAKDIIARFYLPASRVFCISEPIPFQLTLASSALSLAAFLPFGPIAVNRGSKPYTRVQLLRQTTVDVRNAVVFGTKTDIWRTEEIGEGLFKHAGDGPDWMSFYGEIHINTQVKIGGFRAGGLTLKDFIILSMMPPEPARAPFSELRQVIPIRLTTDPWSTDGAGQAFSASDFSIALTPDEAHPDFHVPEYSAS